MLIVFIGPQGSGKGTQAQKLTRYGFKHVSMGQALRDRAKQGDEIAQEIKSYIDNGNLVPSRLTRQAAKREIKQNDKLIFDGYPRTQEQASSLETLAEIDVVVHIDISQEESIHRIQKRRICTVTGETYSIDKLTEEDIKKCREKGGEIIRRKDDTPKKVKKRLEDYHKKTEPLLAYYKEKGVNIIHIHGEATPSQVHEEIIQKLGMPHT